MKSLVLLVTCLLVAPNLCGREVAVFNGDPQHPWNRLYAAMDTGARADDELLVALDDFIAADAQKLLAAPIERALLQSAVWATFDRFADAASPGGSKRNQISALCGAVIQRLAMNETELAALPDNYSAAVKSKVFPDQFDPQHPDDTFLPPDLLSESGSWVMMSAAARMSGPAAAKHVEATQGRSVFYVLVRLPAGRLATLRYLRSLADFPEPYIWNPHFAPYPYARSAVSINPQVPQFPQGTQVALLRRMVLTSSTGALTVTPITESIQFRVYENDPKDARPGELGNQKFYELRLAPAELFKGGHGLRAGIVSGQEKRLSFDQPSPFGGENCNDCHGGVGVMSLNTYTHLFGPSVDSPWFEASQVSLQNDATLKWKKRDYTWGLLRGLLYLH